MSEINGESKLSSSEALFAFVGWLTSRKEKTVMSSSDCASPAVELISEFMNKQNLPDVRDDWDSIIIPMKGKDT